jgi:DNA repair exonuclease SbcCD ATPase subunit
MEYIINAVTKPSKMTYRLYQPTEMRFWFKIDVQGNVLIQQQSSHYINGQGLTSEPISETANIQDNVPIPSCLVEVLKKLIDHPDVDNTIPYWLHFIDVIKLLKKNLKETALTFDYVVRHQQLETQVQELTRTVKELTPLKELPAKHQHLTTQYENLESEYKKLKSQHQSCVSEKYTFDKLKTEIRELTKEKERLKTLFHTVVQEKRKLEVINQQLRMDLKLLMD